jgi:hypothetical protein
MAPPHLQGGRQDGDGKFSTLAAQRKVECEIAEFHKYQQRRRAFVEVNEKICHQRPIPEENEAREQEKKRRKPFSGKWRRK